MTDTNNCLLLQGTALEEPVFSHENHSQRFLRFPLSIRRLSGQSDVIPVIATPQQLQPLLPLTGKQLALEGQLRSFNNRTGPGNRLVISAFAQTLHPCTGEAVNRIRLRGVLCKPPVLRRTPLGRSISDMMLAVNRRYGRSDYLPCIAWGQVAMLTARLDVGSPLMLEGRVQSRSYTKIADWQAFARTAYEVSIMHLLDEEEP